MKKRATMFEVFRNLKWGMVMGENHPRRVLMFMFCFFHNDDEKGVSDVQYSPRYARLPQTPKALRPTWKQNIDKRPNKLRQQPNVKNNKQEERKPPCHREISGSERDQWVRERFIQSLSSNPLTLLLSSSAGESMAIEKS